MDGEFHQYYAVISSCILAFFFFFFLQCTWSVLANGFFSGLDLIGSSQDALPEWCITSNSPTVCGRRRAVGMNICLHCSATDRCFCWFQLGRCSLVVTLVF